MQRPATGRERENDHHFVWMRRIGDADLRGVHGSKLQMEVLPVSGKAIAAPAAPIVLVDGMISVPPVADEVFNQIFLRDLANYDRVNAVYIEYFPNMLPTRFCVKLEMVKPEFLVEIATTAVIS